MSKHLVGLTSLPREYLPHPFTLDNHVRVGVVPQAILLEWAVRRVDEDMTGVQLLDEKVSKELKRKKRKKKK